MLQENFHKMPRYKENAEFFEWINERVREYCGEEIGFIIGVQPPKDSSFYWMGNLSMEKSRDRHMSAIKAIDEYRVNKN